MLRRNQKPIKYRDNRDDMDHEQNVVYVRCIRKKHLIKIGSFVEIIHLQ